MKIELKKLERVSVNHDNSKPLEPKPSTSLDPNPKSSDPDPSPSSLDLNASSLRSLTKSTAPVPTDLENTESCDHELPLSKSEIKKHFYKPVKKLIKNNGYSEDGTALAGVDGLWVILKILKSIMGKSSQNLIDILEENIAKQEEEQIEYLKRMVRKPRVETYYSSVEETEETTEDLEEISDEADVIDEEEYIEECDGYEDCEHYRENYEPSNGDFDFDE